MAQSQQVSFVLTARLVPCGCSSASSIINLSAGGASGCWQSLTFKRITPARVVL